nr:CDP-alcohol phosphatidyltransferase family protein [Leifsonia psychrotolerans]
MTSAQKSGSGVPAYLRWINRRLGRQAAAYAYVLGLTPNIVTALSALLSLVALAMIAFAPSTVGVAMGATALLLAGYALDSADGQLARLTGTGSLAGEWLDHVVDAARLPLFHLAVAVHFFRAGETEWVVMVALGFVVLSSVWFFAQTLADKLLVGSGVPAREHPADSPVWVSFLKLPIDVGFLYLGVALLAARDAFLIFYLGLFAVTVLVAALSLSRKYRALHAASAAATTPSPV